MKGCADHLERMKDVIIPKQILHYKPKGGRYCWQEKDGQINECSTDRMVQNWKKEKKEKEEEVCLHRHAVIDKR